MTLGFLNVPVLAHADDLKSLVADYAVTTSNRTVIVAGQQGDRECAEALARMISVSADATRKKALQDFRACLPTGSAHVPRCRARMPSTGKR